MWRRFAGAVVLALALITPASAQDAPRARLLTVPDGQALSDVFPVVALARGVSGRVVLSCAVQSDGASECSAIEETPGDYGFGLAAEALAADWRFEPIAGTVRVPIVFQNDATEAAIIEASLGVDGGENVDRSLVDASYQQLMATYHALAACRWSGRPRCAMTEGGPQNLRILNNIGFYPNAAHAAGAEGRALIACAFRSGRRVDCAVEGVSSAEHGFGDAALRLVQSIATNQAAQFEPGQVIRVPVDFAFVQANGLRRSNWSEMPDGGDFNRYYPSEAARRGENGSAITACVVQPDRNLTCTVFDATTTAFGQAGVRLAEEFRVHPDSLGLPGFAVGDRIKLLITFRIM